MNHTIDLTTTRGCVTFLIDRRIACRRVSRMLDAINDENNRDKRQARKLRETKNPLLIRRAETLEAQANQRTAAMQYWREQMLACGRELMEFSNHIDAAIPQPLLLDLLNVNTADRRDLSPSDGFSTIAYAKGLEDSAMYRGCDWKQGPLAQAMMRFMSNELLNNAQLQQSAHEYLFGKGGMFEFLPTYRKNSKGEMVRQPPKLRMADQCDLSNDAA